MGGGPDRVGRLDSGGTRRLRISAPARRHGSGSLGGSDGLASVDGPSPARDPLGHGGRGARPEPWRSRGRSGGNVPRGRPRGGPEDDGDGSDAVGRAALLRIEQPVAHRSREGPIRGVHTRHGGNPDDVPRHDRWTVAASRTRSPMDLSRNSGDAEGVERGHSESGGGLVKRSNIRVAVVYIEGTNCEDESVAYFRHLGAQAEKVHLKQLTGDTPAELRRDVDDYDILMIPGGFAAGDYVRAGTIFAARLRSKLAKDLVGFVKAGKPVFGVCNGFQVLVEAGLLPAPGGGMAHSPGGGPAADDSNPLQKPARPPPPPKWGPPCLSPNP